MEQRGFAVAGFRDGDEWRCEALPPAVLADLGVLISALRSQVSDGGPFVIASVDDEFFLIARQVGPRTVLLLSDLTASVEYPLAAQALERLGEEPPEDDELDEVWPVGDLDIFADLGLPEDEISTAREKLEKAVTEGVQALNLGKVDEAMAIAEKIASMSRPAAEMAKSAINRAFETPLSEGLNVERDLFHSTFALEDRSEGMAAFIEKRKPINKNR